MTALVYVVIVFATKLGITYSTRSAEETPILSLFNFAEKRLSFSHVYLILCVGYFLFFLGIFDSKKKVESSAS